MTVSTITQQLLAAKQAKEITFQDLGNVLNRDPLWVAALIFQQASASADEASLLLETLGLNNDLAVELTQFPVKGSLEPVIPTDPLIYRFYEIMQVYGMPLKAVIQEQFGDGIMSAIDFTMTVDREEDSKGERVKITMSGKFLPYKKW